MEQWRVDIASHIAWVSYLTEILLMTQVISVPMCRLCQATRKSCQCIAGRRGGQVVDTYHPCLDVAVEYITNEKFFGRAKLNIALEMLASARCDIRSQVASGKMDGRQLMQVDKDVERLTRKAKGRFFGTVTKMAEMPKSEREAKSGNASKSVAEMLEGYRNRMQTMTMR
jgi:hypothetical protein